MKKSDLDVYESTEFLMEDHEEYITVQYRNSNVDIRTYMDRVEVWTDKELRHTEKVKLKEYA